MTIARPPLDQVLAERVRPVTLAKDRQLPVIPALGRRLLPDGIQRGIGVAVNANRSGGATTVALMLVAGVSGDGGWVAAVGLPGLGAMAAAELGICLERLVLVNCEARQAPQVVASLVDGFPVVLVGPGMLSARDGRRIVARLRDAGSVVVMVDDQRVEGFTTLRLVVSTRWDHDAEADVSGQVPLLTRRKLTVTATGRGAYGIERHDELVVDGSLFGPGGVQVESRGPVLAELRNVRVG